MTDKVLFCKTSYMIFFKEICDADKPYSTNGYVKETGNAGEQHNFRPVKTADGKMCYGRVDTKTKNGNNRSLHIENIKGCESLTDEDKVEDKDILVVFFARNRKHKLVVVGWYKKATVYREYQRRPDYEKHTYEKPETYYNIRAKYEDCVLLPENERDNWEVENFCYGSNLVRYPTKDKDKVYLDDLLKKIEDYKGKNWIDKYPPLKNAESNY